MSLPVIAIVGAPNVGKSTLFNRLVGRRRAIVTDEPGVTRDRLYGLVASAPHPFRVVDTGGLTPGTEAPYARQIEQQAGAALDEAAVVLFVIDTRAGVSALELELAALLRRRPQPLLLVANKVDSETVQPLAFELHRLGLGEPIAVSAEHGLGIDRLLEHIDALLGAAELPHTALEAEPEAVRLAIVGRPNVGKSSLVNRLLGEERVVVSEIPGTTRDAIDTLLQLGERRYLLIDTAGIRRRGKLRQHAERFSVAHARKNIERCDVAVLVLDATEELAAQDAHIAGYVRDAEKPMLVAVNKWDLVAGREAAARRWEERIRERLKFAKGTPLLLVSAKTGQRVAVLLDRVDALHAAAGVRLATPELNRWLEAWRANESALSSGGRAVRLYYATQTGVRPPTIRIFCNDPSRLHFSVRRRLENSLRERFELGAVPIRLEFRGRAGER